MGARGASATELEMRCQSQNPLLTKRAGVTQWRYLMFE